MSLAAIALMALGVLRGFDIIGTEVTNDEGGQTAGNILDAIVWFLPGMTAAFLAFSFHRRDAHRIEDAAAKGERTISWLLAAGCWLRWRRRPVFSRCWSGSTCWAATTTSTTA
jgi:hypothetical protein